jgi:SAM-dependent MidA family methyltransferase
MAIPLPPPEAQIISDQLHTHIQQVILAQEGWISFSDYMRMALYTPGLGYYAANSLKFGADGDFTTAPEITPLFGQTLANTAAVIVSETKGDILEFGAGSGKLAIHLMQALAQKQCLPRHYFILDLSADLRARQQTLIQATLPHLYDRFVWLEKLPIHFEGLMLGNEVLDAMPCHLIYQQNDQRFERGVSLNATQQFIFSDKPLAHPQLLTASAHLTLPNDYLTEIQLEAQGFIKSLADILTKGVMLFIDYGFEEQTYYHPQRHQGTLMCHYRHHAQQDPFLYPGLQDITTHIDFSAIWRVAEAAGLTLAGFDTQAHYLLAAGLTEQLHDTSQAQWYRASQAIQLLTSPAEMGELFKVIALSKNITQAMPGF